MNVPPPFSSIAGALCGLALSLTLASCADRTLSTGDSGGPEVRAGGSTTVFDASGDAFSHPAPNLTGESARLHKEGDDAFDATFVASNGTQF
jgi:CxxC motif-containing protein (DUF1111 family)